MTTDTVARPETESPAPPPEKRLWTYQEMVEKLPESNQPTELWNGELVVSPAPSTNHQKVVGKLFRRMSDFVETHELGVVLVSPTDVVLSSHRTVQPDLLFVAKKNTAIVQAQVCGAPDLTVEVTSESSWRRDRIDKKELYAQFGVKEYWIVDPETRMVEIFVLTDGAYKLHSGGGDDKEVNSLLLQGLKLAFRDIEL